MELEVFLNMFLKHPSVIKNNYVADYFCESAYTLENKETASAFKMMLNEKIVPVKISKAK